MLVSADTLPTPSDAGPVDVGFGWLFASPSALYYSSAAVQRTRAGVFVAGSAMRVPLEGGSSSVLASGYLFSKPVLAGTNLILDGSPVPSGNGDVIFSAPLSGGPPRKIASLDDEIVNGFATDGTYVYFSETSALKAMPLLPDAGSAEIITLVPGMSANIIGAFGNELLFGYPQGAVESLPLPPRANSPVTVLGTSLAGPLDLMPCGTNACWLAGANDTIEQLKLPDGAPMPVVTLTDGVSTAFDATYDGKYAYVIGTDYRRTRNTLARVPLDGSCPVVLIRMPSSDGASVAMDDECVYWSSSQGIFSLAKSSSGVFDQ